MKHYTICVLAGLTLLSACGSDDEQCNAVNQTGCADGLVCEVIDGSTSEAKCFAPVYVQGRVFNLENDASIAGARVVALDVNGSPASLVAISASDGTYRLRVSHARSSDGTPVGKDVTLRADSAGFQTFPSGVRQALPVTTTGVTMTGADYVLQSTQTDIGLIGMSSAPTGEIFGTVAANDDNVGSLVVAEVGGVGYTAIADRSGSYRIFNLPDGSYTVKAYAKGFNYAMGGADIVSGGEAEVNLALDGAKEASDVSGTVTFVDPGMGMTSVILVVASTFNENLARGFTPPGLRAPEAGPPSITSAFTITGVPEGSYKVLAAFENDNFVRDVSSIGGTEIQDAQVVAGQDLSLAASFKVTGALDVVSPGANGPEAVSATPTFSWKDDSSEDGYDLFVYDNFGNEIFSVIGLAPSMGSDPSVMYAGPALTIGMFYQFRVLSKKMGDEISRTEDLKGVFYLPIP